MLKHTYDEEADAIYVSLANGDYAYGEELDPERRVDYASDGTPIGVELLCVRTGVNLRSLPDQAGIAAVLAKRRIRVLAS